MEHYKKKKFFLICFFSFIIMIIVSSPLLNINNIVISNNKSLSNDEILSLIKLNDKTNIFAFSIKKAKKALLNNPYIDNVNINKNYISRSINIDIKERKVIGYIKFDQNLYIYIDKEGHVLDIKSYFIDVLPVVVGLKFSEVKIGEIINIENKGAFNTLITLSHLFEKYKIDNNIIKVDISDENDICFYYGKIYVKIGNILDVDEKIRIVTTILPEIEHLKDIGGYLTVKDVNKPWIFKLLT